MSISSFKRGYSRLLLFLVLVVACLAMARFQLWRAETRGERFEREQAALVSTPIALSPQQRQLLVTIHTQPREWPAGHPPHECRFVRQRFYTGAAPVGPETNHYHFSSKVLQGEGRAR